MKRIYSADIEADSLDAKVIHCMSITELQDNKVVRSWDIVSYEEMREVLKEDVIWIFHNGLCYDKPTLERVLGVEIKGEVIDTLPLSWYLFPLMRRHGLAQWGEYFGVPKPEIDDWVNLPIETYIHRCSEDVKIQTKLWLHCFNFLYKLYGNSEDVWRVIRHITFKMNVVALQEKSGWKLDEGKAEKLKEVLDSKYLEASIALEDIMPNVDVIAYKTRPKKPFKSNGSLSKFGIKWGELTKAKGIDFDYKGRVPVVTGVKPPNAGSSSQVKDYLYSLGWVPETFKFVREGEDGKEMRKIPQIRTMEGDLCPSIERLIVPNPDLKYLADMGVVRHRISICKGFLESVDDDGFVKASAQGFTNTLRLKHRTCVNIPSTRKPYGKEIRSLLCASDDNHILCGSDQSSLEDRTKQHFMWAYDSEYVKDMQVEGFDPHCDLSLVAGLMTEEEVREYKDPGIEKGRKVELAAKRYKGKTTNYAATYGAGAATIARAADISIHEAESLHQAYWGRNWSVKAIADNCKVKEVTYKGIKLKWLWNPISHMWIHLKAEKDRFSTLNQSTATYCFDRWVYHILQERCQITATFHDEIVLNIFKGREEATEDLILDANEKMNIELNLNRELECDIDFGMDYSEIH